MQIGLDKPLYLCYGSRLYRPYLFIRFKWNEDWYNCQLDKVYDEVAKMTKRSVYNLKILFLVKLNIDFQLHP